MYFNRNFENEVDGFLRTDKPKIAILIGARRVGKSSYLKNLLQNNDNAIYFDLEKPDDVLLFEDYKNFVPLIEKGKILLVDEFQVYPESTKTFKILYDHYPKTKIIASGSSSLAIRKSLRESLSGRKRIFDIYPLSFGEFLRFIDKHEEKSFANFDIFKPDLISSRNFFSYSVSNRLFGFLPEVVLENEYEQKRLLLQDVYQSYLIKDIKSFIKDSDSISFNKLLKILASSIASLVNYNELASTVRASRYKIEEYIYILEQTFIIRKISPYEANVRREIKKMQKIYFVDIGLRNQIINDFSDIKNRRDLGYIFENVVFSELLKTKPLFADILFWRTALKTEIDFILKKDSNIIPVECKIGAKKNYLPRSFSSFYKKVKFNYGIVVTENTFYTKRINNFTLLGVPIWAVSKLWRLL